MKILKALAAASAAFFIVSAHAQNIGTVTNHAIPIGKGVGVQGFSSALCASAQLLVGQTSADPLCKTVTGDVTIDATGATAIGATKVTNAMLAGSIAFSKLVGSDITTVGTIATGVWNGTAVDLAHGGTGQATAKAARSSSGLNVEAFTGHGDSIYAILSTDRVVGTNAAFTASRTWTLPAANALNAGQCVQVFDFQGTVTGANTLVITRAGSDTVNGGTSVTINTANGGYLLCSDGSSKWSAQAVGSTAIAGVSSLGGLTGSVGVANGIEVSGANIQVTAARRTLPTKQVFTSSSGTYTTPANVLWLEITIIGAGAGGSGANNTGPASAGNSCWNTSGAACTTPVYQGSGGSAGNAAAAGAGGGVTGSSSCDWSAAGGGGGSGSSATASTNQAGGVGGGSSFGGAGLGGTSTGGNAGTNTGGGGGGGGEAAGTAASSGGGGGAGGTCHVIINSPAASYTYAVGAGTNGSAGGTGGGTGGNGAAGIIVVYEHYGT